MSDPQPAASTRGRPDRGPAGTRPDGRTARERAGDHAAIDRLADELVPALISKLGSTNLGEIEVREGAWRVRLRRPSPSGVNYGRRASDRASRSQPGHEGHGHAPAALEGHRAGRGSGSAGAAGASGPGGASPTNGSQTPGLAAVGPGRGGDGRAAGEGRGDGASADRSFATSPAVGVFQPAGSAATGARVKAGDRLGVVDMLGVPHEVVAPTDGVIGAALVEAGHAVEYGQELIRIELAGGRDAGREAAREGGG